MRVIHRPHTGRASCRILKVRPSGSGALSEWLLVMTVAVSLSVKVGKGTGSGYSKSSMSSSSASLGVGKKLSLNSLCFAEGSVSSVPSSLFISGAKRGLLSQPLLAIFPNFQSLVWLSQESTNSWNAFRLHSLSIRFLKPRALLRRSWSLGLSVFCHCLSSLRTFLMASLACSEIPGLDFLVILVTGVVAVATSVRRSTRSFTCLSDSSTVRISGWGVTDSSSLAGKSPVSMFFQLRVSRRILQNRRAPLLSSVITAGKASISSSRALTGWPRWVSNPGQYWNCQQCQQCQQHQRTQTQQH